MLISWRYKEGDETFDITMGGFHGAEICEVVGLYVLDKLEDIMGKGSVGIYRDDGLTVLDTVSERLVDKTKKKLHEFSKSIGLRITIEGPIEKTDFLDTTLNLRTRTYEPYIKPNNNMVYLNKNSNHPITIKKELPKSIGKRLSNRSSSINEFTKAAPRYEKALEKSGYGSIKLSYQPATTKKKKNRRRNCTWYNPPFCQTVATSVKRKFINLVERNFTKNNPLHKIFNKNNMKVSYSCMRNVKSLINSHNAKILRDNTQSDPPCNCSDKHLCPLKGQKDSCRAKDVIYQATVETASENKFYIGLTSTEFKKRVAKHKTDFKIRKYENSTELSKYIWQLKDKNEKFSLSWKIINRSRSLRNGDKACRLCIKEAALILQAGKDHLNKRKEITSTCRHRKKHLLASYL